MNEEAAYHRPLVNKRCAKKARFVPEEDERLLQLIAHFGIGEWANIASMMPGRNERQVRDRYLNFLNPSINKDPWSKEEDALLRKLIKEYGAKWVKFTSYFDNRTDVALKTRWMTLKRQDARREGLVFKASSYKPIEDEMPSTELPPPLEPPLIPLVDDIKPPQESFRFLDEVFANLVDDTSAYAEFDIGINF